MYKTMLNKFHTLKFNSDNTVEVPKHGLKHGEYVQIESIDLLIQQNEIMRDALLDIIDTNHSSFKLEAERKYRRALNAMKQVEELEI